VASFPTRAEAWQGLQNGQIRLCGAFSKIIFINVASGHGDRIDRHAVAQISRILYAPFKARWRRLKCMHHSIRKQSVHLPGYSAEVRPDIQNCQDRPDAT
jgi:hypothetical protein